MTRLMHIVAMSASISGSALSASAADILVEDFESGTNIGAWQWYGSGDHLIQEKGGNPGAYVTKILNQSPSASLLSLDPAAPFFGNWREQRVIGFGVDLATFLTSDNLFPENPFVVDFMITVQIANNNGTPGNLYDDTVFYFQTGELPPFVGEGWKSLDIVIPSQATDTSEGWVFYDDPFLPPVPDPLSWEELMQNVSYIRVQYGQPEAIFAIHNWICGGDNIRITYADAADFDFDGLVGPADLAELLAQWGPCAPKGPCPADLDENGQVGPADLAELLASWTSS